MRKKSIEKWFTRNVLKWLSLLFYSIVFDFNFLPFVVATCQTIQLSTMSVSQSHLAHVPTCLLILLFKPLFNLIKFTSFRAISFCYSNTNSRSKMWMLLKVFELQLLQRVSISVIDSWIGWHVESTVESIRR